MASAELRVTAGKDWVLANPWFWMGTGLLSTGLAWSWVAAFGDGASAIRFLLICVGLLSTAGAIVIRLNSSAPPFLDAMSGNTRKLVTGGLVLVFGALAMTVSVLLLLRLAGVELLWKPGSLVLIWLIVVPMSASAAWFCSQQRESGRKISEREEAAALLVLGALSSVFACFALYLGKDRASEWESIRLLFAVVAFVALVAAPLVVVRQGVRRGVISLLILLHFGGICSATLAVPPTPWIISQLWTRIYRPYLEFMYLTNAYHFYSPDPGPATYLWFRLIYEDDEGKTHGDWYKIPEFDDRGRPKDTFALTYQRILALTENVTHKTTPPPDWEPYKEDGQIKWRRAEYFVRRARHTPDYKEIVGEPLRKDALRIPFHPTALPVQQYEPPQREIKPILESYVRHACLRRHPEHPEWTVKSVKVYRVIHQLPVGPYATAYLSGYNATDPEFYRPYFVGEFDTDGKLLNPMEPFLYWLLPIYRDGSFILDYARKHAGDEKWIARLSADGKQVEEWIREGDQ
jgi:hypothetical protein